MREVVGCFVHKEAWEKLGQAQPQPNGDDEALREQVIDAAGRAKSEQRALTNASNRLVLDRMFDADLREERPPRPGVVVGLPKGKVTIELDDPAIAVKVYTAHLEEQGGEALRLTDDGARLVVAKGGRRVATLGDRVHVRVVGTDEGRDRWVLGLEGVG
jgi:exoribonuclease R